MGLASLAVAGLLGCAVRSKPSPEPTPVATPATAKVAAGRCVASVAVVGKTTSRMSFSVENRSEGRGTGRIRQIRLLFTAARCPRSLETPEGWTGSIEARPGEHACEVAWVSSDGTGIPTRARKDGFAAVFAPRKTEVPSWALFLDECAVTSPHGAAAK
jgi:hypothetical protein